jgi:murein DD-endopeptidase MepM/ murein hydrolase activator NlpD
MNPRYSIAPETYLYSAITEAARHRRSEGFVIGQSMTAYVVAYAGADGGLSASTIATPGAAGVVTARVLYGAGKGKLFDATRDGVRLYYPRGYCRAFIWGLDDNIPFDKCRVFAPEDADLGKQALEIGDAITVYFPDMQYGHGIWKGKLTQADDVKEAYAKMIRTTTGPNALADPERGVIMARPGGVRFDSNSGEPDEQTLILKWPVDEESLSRANIDKVITGEFGVPRPGHDHQGVDIRTGHPTTPNDPTEIFINAAYDGEIVSVTPNWQGNSDALIVVQHTNPTTREKFATRYIHISDPSVRVGEFVTAGTHIARPRYYEYQGTSQPHLHFEVIRDWDNPATRRAVNPQRNNMAILGISGVS